MECPLCKQQARIAYGRFRSDVDSTDVFHEAIMVCVNPECANYETNMENPAKVIDVIISKVN